MSVLQFLLWFLSLKHVDRISLSLVSSAQAQQMSAEKCERGGFLGVKEPTFSGPTCMSDLASS